MNQRSFVWFRLLTSLIFIYAGSKHVLHTGKILMRLKQTALYELMGSDILLTAMIIASGVIMMAGGICLLLGWRQKQTAFALLLMLIPITLSVQLDNLNDLGPFFKNLAISGSLILLMNEKYSQTQNNPVIGRVVARRLVWLRAKKRTEER